MKKPYLKPELYAESFRLVEHISLDCKGTMGTANHDSAIVCEYDIGDAALLFYSGNIETTCTHSKSPKYNSLLAEEGPFVTCYNGIFNGNEVMAFVGS